MDTILAELAGNGILGIVLAVMIYWMFAKEKTYNSQRDSTNEYIINLHVQHASEIDAINQRHADQVVGITNDHREKILDIVSRYQSDTKEYAKQNAVDRAVLLETLGRVATAMEHQSSVMEQSLADRAIMEKLVEAYVGNTSKQ